MVRNALPDARMNARVLRLFLQEWLIVLAFSPLLIFPTLIPAMTMAVLGLLLLMWIRRLVITGQAWPVTPFNVTLLIFGGTIVMGALVSYHPDLTLRKITNLILGLALFRGIALATHTRRDLTLALGVFFLIGTGFLLVGALTTQWPTQKTPWLAPVVRRFPRVQARLPELSTSFVNPNQLAAVGLLYFPLAFALLRERPFGDTSRRSARALYVVLSILAVGSLLITFFTQSRGGWMGIIGAGWTLILLWRYTSRRWGTRVLLLGPLLLILVAGLVTITRMDASEVRTVLTYREREGGIASLIGRSNMAWRWEVWHQALQLIQYAPWTGIGLGTYRRVGQQLFPSEYLSKYHEVIYDSHHIFLQAAVDLGVGGLVAYLALVGTAALLGVKMAASSDRWIRAIAIGGVSSIVGLHLYGLLNAMAPGSKPGLLFWFLLGLLAAAANVERLAQGR